MSKINVSTSSSGVYPFQTQRTEPLATTTIQCMPTNMPTKKIQKIDALQTMKYWSLDDVNYMAQALQIAEQGAAHDEVPVGAILVCEDKIIGEGFNQPICNNDPTAHAEIVALRSACKHIDNYRLPRNSTLYVTLEPCTMCLGALIHARLDRLVFATTEPRAGMVGSQLDLTAMNFYNHKISVSSGLFASASKQQLKNFFKLRRTKKKKL